MCGIAGIFDAGGVPDRATLETARDTLAHRGPDAAGLFVSSRNDAALLFRRLSIIDVSTAGHQPFGSDDGACWLVFNGEVYNFEALRETLRERGHHFHSQSDTEVVLHAFQEWGAECVQRFVGMFAFAVWDERTRTLFAARDRIGIKPFYYQHTGRGFRFGSELKALVALPGADRTVDDGALWQYLSRGYVSSPETIYASVRSLPPAHRLTWAAATGALRIERYWDPLDAWQRGVTTYGTRPPDRQTLIAELDDRLRAAVALRLRSDVPLGAFLSGGIDSSLVVALMAATGGTRTRTFTVGFEDVRYDESADAKRIADHLGASHEVLLATNREALDLIPHLPDSWDEPFADSSAIATYLVCRLARQHVTVAVSGDGGDELCAGYSHYWTVLARLRRARQVPRFLSHLMSMAGRGLRDSRLRRALLSLPLADDSERFFDYFTSIWRPDELRRLAPALSPPQWAGASRVQDQSATDLARFTLSDLQRYLPHDILTKVDRASMAVSLEARVPLLDHRVVEFMVGLPDEARVYGGHSKALLRDVLRKYLPASLIGGSKRGFAVPLDAWLRGPLKDLLHTYLSPDRLRASGRFEPRVVDGVVRQFFRGDIGHDRVWVLLMYQLWAEKYGVA